MLHILVITGGYLDIPFAKDYIETLSYDKVFAVDRGLEYADELGVVPDLILGDFDTASSEILKRYEQRIENEGLNSEIVKYPTRKDLTDSALALHYAKEYGASKVTLIGATGSRIDHMLSNIGLLIYSNNNDMECIIVDANNRIQLICGDRGKNECVIRKEEQWGKYVSVIPVSPYIAQVTLEGVEYPLNNAKVSQGLSLTVSNEIKEEAARFRVGEGTALIIESKD